MTKRFGFALRCLAVSAIALGPMGTASAQTQIFNSTTTAGNNTAQASWLAASGIGSPAHLVDFESGFTNGQNIDDVTGLFPLSMVVRATAAATPATIKSGAGSIAGSSPIDTFALTHNESAFLEFDFTANPVDYLGFYDIDHTGAVGTLFFVGGGTQSISLDQSQAGEFWGVWRNNQPRIQRIQLDASGDGTWGVDNIQYGTLDATAVPEPASIFLLLPCLGTLRLLRRARKSR